MTDDSFKTFVCDQLAGLGVVYFKRMFGGYGGYCGETFFAILASGKLYFKTNADTRQKYEAQKMKPFQPSKGHTLKNYYQVPVAILEDADTLTRWATEAVAVAQG